MFEELLSNAIDSYLIRKNNNENVPPLDIKFEVSFVSSSTVDQAENDITILCHDNGAGFGDDEVEAFVTKDSTYKDLLDIRGIDRCKGAGRIQFFHFFNSISIDSRYQQDEVFQTRTLSVYQNTRKVSAGDFNVEPSSTEETGTTFKLSGLSDACLDDEFNRSSIKSYFSAEAIKLRLLVAFMQRFLVLKDLVGDFAIEIGDGESSVSINSEDFPSPNSEKEVSLICSHHDGDQLPVQPLKVTVYKLAREDFANFEHEVALVANSSLVKSLKTHFFRSKAKWSIPIDEYFYLIFISSDYLENKVNTQRDGFDMPEVCKAGDDMFGREYSIQDIKDSVEDYIYTYLTPSDFDKDALITSTEQKFGISNSMLQEVNIKVHYGDSENNIAKRVLKKYQDDIVKETSDLFDLKEQLLLLDPTDEGFRDSVNELSWKYTSTIKKMDMANLSQLVVRRSSMLEVLRYAVEKLLRAQTQNQGRRQDEKIIHNVFFPTGKDSGDDIDHDIWILNEEYHYFDHISSDKVLASIPWHDGGKLFSDDVDEALETLFKKYNDDHSLKRPDIAIFNQEGAAIIIEFKAPGVELQEHVPDLVQYARLLAAKSGGKIKKFYGYLIGDCLDESRMPTNFTKFARGTVFFRSERIKDFNTDREYGELYSEVLFYEGFIDRAEKRLDVYKGKLGI